MILSKEHQFCMIHIPKCAGTYLRNKLGPLVLDEKNYNKIVEHPALGRIDYTHIPLFIMKDYFFSEYDLLQKYFSFVVVRDPFERFLSSLSQKLKMYSDIRITNRSEREINFYIDEAIEFLSRNKNKQALLPHDYIHFQRQIDYVKVNDQQIIKNIYTTDEINKLLEDLSEHLGKDLLTNKNPNEEGRVPSNKTKVFRNEFIKIFFQKHQFIIKQLSRSAPEILKQKIRDSVYLDGRDGLKKYLEMPNVQEFIKSYYKEDIMLFEKINK